MLASPSALGPPPEPRVLTLAIHPCPAAGGGIRIAMDTTELRRRARPRRPARGGQPLQYAAHQHRRARVEHAPHRKLQLALKPHAQHELGEQHHRSLALLDRDFERLCKLGEDVLGVARMQAGQMRLEPQPIQLRAVLREGEESFAEQAHARGVALAVACDGDPSVRADPRRLTQVSALAWSTRSTTARRRETRRRVPRGRPGRQHRWSFRLRAAHGATKLDVLARHASDPALERDDPLNR